MMHAEKYCTYESRVRALTAHKEFTAPSIVTVGNIYCRIQALILEETDEQNKTNDDHDT